MFNIKKTLEELIKTVEKEEFKDTEKILFLRQFTLNYNELMNLSFSDLFMILNSNQIEYNDYLKHKECLNNITLEDYGTLLELSSQIHKLLLENKNLFINNKKDFKKLSFSNIIKTFIRITFINEKKEFDIDCYNFFIKVASTKEGLCSLATISHLYSIKVQRLNGNMLFDSKIFKKLLKEFTQNNKDNFLNKMQNLSEETISDSTYYIGNLQNQERKFYTNKNKKIKILNEVLECFNNNKEIDIKKLEKYIDNTNLIIMINIYNDSLKKDNYLKLKQENIKLSNNKISKIKQILYDYNINLDENKIKIDIDTLKNKIDYIVKYLPNLKEYTNIIYILINELDINIFISLINLKRSNTISDNFILENFVNICNNELLTNFIKNIELLNNLKIDIKTICKYNREVLFMNFNKLNNIINSYLVYGIKLSSDCYNYELLTEDYTNIIDRFIEIDEYDLIKNNISYIKMSSNDIPKRIVLNKLIGNNSINENGKFENNVKSEENYFISDNDLHNIIIENYVDLIPFDILEVLLSNTEYDYNYVDLSILEEFYYNDRSYKIDNLIISKNKIIKNYNKIKNSNLDYSDNEILFYSILYNHPTTIRYYDINNLKEILNVKKLIK